MPASYCSSPSVSTASEPASRAAVYLWRHAPFTGSTTPSPLFQEGSVGSQAMSPAADTTDSGMILWSRFRNMPVQGRTVGARQVGWTHAVEGSTAVPSSHWFQVVTSWKRSLEATMSPIALSQSTLSRDTVGFAAPACHAPGLIANELPDTCDSAAPGA